MKKIEKIAEKYAKSEKTIILSVVPGHIDPSNWKANTFAKKYDPSGKRTLCVITKVDVDTHGESWVNELLRGKIYPLANGYIAVKWRSQNDSMNKVTLKEWLENEKKFFENHKEFKDIAEFQGVEYLRCKLK